MALKITCPHCGHPMRLVEPYPLPGTERQCACGRALAITYPVGLMDTLRGRGVRFEGDDDAPRRPALPPAAPPPPPPEPTPTRPVARERLPAGMGGPTVIRPLGVPLDGPPTDPTVQDRPHPGEGDATAVGPRAGPAVFRPLDPPRPAERRPDRPPERPAVAPPGRGAPPPGRPPAKGRRRWLARGAAGAVVIGLLILLLGAAAVAGVVWYYSRDLPTVETLGRYRPPTVTVVYDRNRELLGEIYDQRRYVIPLEEMPEHLRQAFISAEDAGFYQHGGVDVMGIVRAVVRNALAGRKAQGASTITQQVARNFLLSNEKTYERKLKEMLLARRVESTFEKDHILYLYLNEIYLGSRAYGVEAAARVYFGKHASELDVAESALIAGLPQRPSDYSPHRNFDKAKARQKYVLDQMVDNGYLTRAQADAAYAQPLDIVERGNAFLRIAPWFSEYIRIQLVERYGEDKVLNEGLVVESTCDLALQREAQKAVTEGVLALDERKGWRGPEETLAEDAIAERVARLAKGNPELFEGERYTGVVTEVRKDLLVVDLGQARALVPLAWTTWAVKVEEGKSSGGKKIDDLTRSFTRGDVVRVEVKRHRWQEEKALAGVADGGQGPYLAAEVYQPPDLQGALFSYRLTDGAVLAMVGGPDFLDTKFNRAVQAERQVGSTFKPIVYAAAIESKRFTAGTIVQDAPLIYNTVGRELWKPENFGSDYLGDITLRRALALSRNVVTVRVLDRIGIDPVLATAKRLGIDRPLEPDLSVGLGSASLTLPEMARAYGVFATLGRKVDYHFIDRVLDRDGTVLEAYTPPERWEQVLDPEVASIMNWLLVEVATAGTAAKAQRLGLHVAGKTGTTNDFKDAWFVGYTPDVVTAVWVGYDQPRSIGGSATGGQIALPIWMDFMEDAVPKAKDRPFPAAPGLQWAPIDEKTGRVMTGGRDMPFLAGTVPAGQAMEAGQKTSEDLLTTEF